MTYLPPQAAGVVQLATTGQSPGNTSSSSASMTDAVNMNNNMSSAVNDAGWESRPINSTEVRGGRPS
jgi:spore coat protein CotF